MSLRDGFDLSTPSGRLMFQIIGAMGEFERNLIRERARAGMAHAKAKGTRLGRGRTRVDMTAVQARRAGGESLRAIARIWVCLLAFWSRGAKKRRRVVKAEAPACNRHILTTTLLTEE